MATVLIIDDTQFILRYLSIALTPFGFRVQLAGKAMEALALITFELPDVILLDCQMPGLSGENLARLLKANPLSADIPLILISSDKERLANFKEVGAQAFLEKPINTGEMVALINQLMAPMPKEAQLLKMMLPGFGAKTAVESRVVQFFPPGEIHLDPENLDFSLQKGDLVSLSYETAQGVPLERKSKVWSFSKDRVVVLAEEECRITERRRFFRKEVELSVRYRLPGDFFRLARTNNLSGGGMKVIGMGGKRAIGTPIELQLILEAGIQLPLLGAISWVEEEATGIEFKEVEPQLREQLTLFLFSGFIPSKK